MDQREKPAQQDESEQVIEQPEQAWQPVAVWRDDEENPYEVVPGLHLLYAG